MSEASHRPVVPYFEIVAAFLLVWAVVRLLRFRYGRQRRNVVAARLAAEDASFIADEDAQARYRLTGARLAKALPASGEFDAVLVGSGPGSLGCAAALSQMGYKCCVLEQGEQLGGGAHVFSDVGYEFETGVHYLGNDEAMKGMLSFLTCGRLALAPLGTQVASGKKMYDSVIIGAEDEYQFCEGVDSLISMLKTRFQDAPNHVRIDAFEAVLRGTMTSSYQDSAASFFVLKVPWLLNLPALQWLRSLLQMTVMGGSYYQCTQMTTEDMLRSCDIEPSSLLGAVIIGQ